MALGLKVSGDCLAVVDGGSSAARGIASWRGHLLITLTGHVASRRRQASLRHCSHCLERQPLPSLAASFRRAWGALWTHH